MKIIYKGMLKGVFIFVGIATIAIASSYLTSEYNLKNNSQSNTGQNLKTNIINISGNSESVADSEYTGKIEDSSACEGKICNGVCISIDDCCGDECNVKQCEKIDDRNLKSNCYIDLAKKTNNKELCNKAYIDDQASCFMQFANQAKDASFCKGLPTQGEKNICLSEVALLNKDVSICKESSGIPYMNIDSFKRPYDFFSAWLSSCGDKDVESYCYYNYAVKNKDINVCNEVSGYMRYNRKEYECSDACYAQYAINNSDLEKCFMIDGPIKPYIGYCVSNALKVLVEVSECDKLENILNNDPRVALSEKYLSTQCLISVAENTNNVSVCDKIDHDPTKKNCYDSVY